MRATTNAGQAARAAIVAAALCLAAGCLKVKETLTIKPDGSGTLIIETQSPAPPALLAMARQQGMSPPDRFSYPPLSEADAGRLFPQEGFDVQVRPNPPKAGGSGVVVEVAFQDINALMTSPYGRARLLHVSLEGGKLRVAGISGLQLHLALSQSEEMPPYPVVAELTKKKKQMAAEFNVTLPDAIDSSNGKAEGPTATWTMDRSKTQDIEEARRVFGTVMRASCPAEAVKFTPAPPTRLGLQPFAELPEGPTGEAVSLPDPKAIAAAAAFVPCSVKITRSFDLSGEGHTWENDARLLGAIVLPKKFQPDAWGQIHVLELTDEKGNDLMQPADEPDFYRSRTIFNGTYDGSHRSESDITRFYALPFKVPQRGVRRLAHVRAEVELRYFGARQVVKIPKAILKEDLPGSNSLESPNRTLAHPKLAELGLDIQLSMVQRRLGAIHCGFQLTGTESSIDTLQVYDVDGTPCTTFSMGQTLGLPGGMTQLVVLGSPQPPLSLALLVRTGGAGVKVPIQLEKVPLTEPRQAAEKPQEK